ncbi:GPN-loop GTPase 2 isoform X2 [Calonectris borealis]|uniref:GPN-loop GTPase 2 isoform X2 n=1 Tax=Calonectris borealis TaxID=1323832 RepID=UPI003F4BDE9B
MCRGHRRAHHPARRDGELEAGTQRGVDLLHGVPGGQLRLAAGEAGCVQGSLLLVRLPRAGGALHPPRRPEERLRAVGQVEFQAPSQAVPKASGWPRHGSDLVPSLCAFALQLAAVHLVDSHYCTDPGKFISVLCTSLSTMLHVELPHVNILSKMDLIEQYGKLAFNLDYYTEVLDLSYLVDHLASDPFFRNYRRLNEKLVEVIEDYSLVSFVPLNVQDKESMRQVMQAVDKANGYSFGDQEHRSLEALMSAAVGADFHFTSTLAVQEKYVQSQDKAVEEEVMDL